MKLPAIAIASVFALGIVFGLLPTIAHHAATHSFLAWLFAFTAVALLAGVALAHANQLALAAVASLSCWALLGITGACLAEQPRRADHILQLADAGTINWKTPLRYFGRLRDEPEPLPWGVRYEIDLSGVELVGAIIPATGGLRLSYVPRPVFQGTQYTGKQPGRRGDRQPEMTSVPELHAGDAIAVLTQARLPQVFRNEGAFDRRVFLSRQKIDVVANLRAPQLLELVQPGRPTIATRIARTRRRLREQIDALLPTQTNIEGVLRAMLLGDKSFVDRDESMDFQKTGAFHVLVVAGLHVAAFALLVSWIGRRLRFPHQATVAFTLILLFGYVCVVEQRAPVLRAALMAAIVVVGRVFFRRLDLLNTVAVAAIILLVASPAMLRDSSFQFSFLAIACIAGLGAPWLERTVQPYARALRGWRDVTRDISHEARQAQFRIDLRTMANVIETRLPLHIGKLSTSCLTLGLASVFRVWELFVLSTILQIGMLPLFAREFHRIPLAGPMVNFAAVPLIALIVPFGFLTLLASFLFFPLGRILAIPLSWITILLLHIVQWFAHFPRLSSRTPGAAVWITFAFLVTLILLMTCFRMQFPARRLVTYILSAILAAGAILITTSPFPPRMDRGKLELTILDVRQGDSLFVVSPRGKTILIGGGGAFTGFPGQPQQRGVDPGEEAVSPYLWSRGFKTIDVVAVTHAHQDHLGGLTAILENFHVGRLWIGREASAPALANLEALAREKNISLEHESRGKTFSLDGVSGQFLWPEVPAEAASNVASEVSALSTAKNNDSLVLHLQYGKRSLLLPGDAEKQAERVILAENPEEILHADVLKIGHHGSKNSTTMEFLSAVHPQVAVISAGENNSYGHPSLELLERLNIAGVRSLRTDRDGAVHILTDGDRLEISCFVACPDPPIVSVSRPAESPDRRQNNQQQ